jgi:thioredoxin-related protein
MSKIILVLLLFSVAIVACSQKKEQKVEAPSAKVQNEYPPIILKFDDAKELSAKNLEGNNVFILFQPDCDHCQHEAVMIEQRLEDFKDYHLYFISSAPMENIVAFGKNFHLFDKEKVKFAWTSTEGVLTYYGSIPTPSIYVYSHGKLKQTFNGQTDIENIIRAL